MILLLGLLVSAYLSSYAQALENYREDLERIYGKDAELLNGEKYYYPYRPESGDPFLISSGMPSTICISGREFNNQIVRYDIYNQDVVLEYEDLYGGNNNIVLRNDWIESFTLGNKKFKKMVGPDGDEKIYQEIYSDSISCYYHWKKDYLLKLSSGVQNYYFTDPIRKAYLFINNVYYPFRNKRQFIKIISDDLQKEVKGYMKKNRIRIKHISDAEMRELIIYCNSIGSE
jgi:hypothetical protein